MGNDLEFLAFDIETTGFDVTDEVTIIGFEFPLGTRIFLQTGGRKTNGLESTVRERADHHVSVSTNDSELALFEAVESFATDRFRDDDLLLVAYNGERWNSGFDLPFLRTRFAMADVAWPFRDLPYADLMPVLNKRFNTTADGETHSDLETVYELLLEGDFGELDPFENSGEAVTAFEDGEFADLVMHNVADVLRTDALGKLAQQYCSKSDFKLKSLTPTVYD
jgi:uncharacterized protein YprB with RNaseH-like and TPR domain